jgi:predicted small secreted protein
MNRQFEMKRFRIVGSVLALLSFLIAMCALLGAVITVDQPILAIFSMAACLVALAACGRFLGTVLR